MLVAVGATATDPEVALVPDHAPDAVQEVVLLEDQVRVVLPPATIELGFAATEIVGAATDEDELALDFELDEELELETELLDE